METDRRLIAIRIKQLKKRLEKVHKRREQGRRSRQKADVPTVSLVGYTNAGKSTLLNTLTKSSVLAESRLFATLDPSSRRLKFPKDIEVIITDTVGFIKDLPKDLMVAFRATLEELESADLLLHVVDMSNSQFGDQIKAVDKILLDLNLQHTASIRVLNKMDLMAPESVERLSRSVGGIAVSAKNSATLMPLIEKMATLIEKMGQT